MHNRPPLPRRPAKPHALNQPLRPQDRPRIHFPTPCSSPHVGPDGQPIYPTPAPTPKPQEPIEP